MSIILITGASSGIGKATAQNLLKQNHTVYVAARRIEAMKDLQEQGAIPLRLDITNDDEINQIVDKLISSHNGVDVLINNAGFGMYGSIEETSINDARYQFEVNLFGMARLTQLLIPTMRAKKSGKIINISSMGGKIYTPLGAWYHATKHAVEGWSDCLRIELSPFGIDVVIIEPGIINTEFGNVMMSPMLERSGQGPYGRLAQSIAKTSLKGSEPKVVADVIVKAINASHPKTRYVAGSMARLLMFVRKYFGDRFYDRIIMSQIGRT